MILTHVQLHFFQFTDTNLTFRVLETYHPLALRQKIWCHLRLKAVIIYDPWNAPENSSRHTRTVRAQVKIFINDYRYFQSKYSDRLMFAFLGCI